MNNRSDYPDELIAQYDKIIAACPEVKRKGKANPYTSLNGNMFSFITKVGTLALRLSKEEREKFMAEHKTSLVVHYNTVMKEYVEVPLDLYSDLKRMKKYFRMSFDYANSLKPKSTKKKKS